MVTHGHKRTGKASPTYKIWLGIKRRCTDEKSKDFPKYGAKGIRVSDEWSTSFVTFLADMGERPSLEHTIDRINPAGNYEASNCRWATKFEQGSEHKRNLRSVTVDGITYPSIRAACRHFGVSPTTVNMRLKDGHPIEVAVSTPTRGLPNMRTRESYLPKNGIQRIRLPNGRFSFIRPE
jgi:hypothetical protein